MENQIIPLSRPAIAPADFIAVNKILESGMLVQGEQVREMETLVHSYIGTQYALAVSSGTAALHLSLLAIDIKPGDEVIVPAFSFVATANVVEMVGAIPVFIDVSDRTFNLLTEEIEKHITQRTKAIIAVHEFGLPCDIHAIKEICTNHNLLLIEDAACAFGASEMEQKVGSFGDLACFSLHPRKLITTGEGGVITTNNEAFANKISILRNHGLDFNSGQLDVSIPGLNYRLTDFQAALFNEQFKRIQSTLEQHRQIAVKYQHEINHKYFLNPVVDEDKVHTWQTYHLMVSGGMNRNDLIRRFKDNGMQTNFGAQCIPAMTYYRRKYNLNPEQDFPGAYNAYRNGLAIPLFAHMKEEEIIKVIKVVNQIS